MNGDKSQDDLLQNDLLQDETMITEITIQADGRIYVFGTSRQVLDVLEDLRPRDVRLGKVLEHVRAIETANDDGGNPRAA
jgi:hypothetical protein